MKQIDMTNVQESGDFKSPTPGAYICTIEAVEDVADKEYLKITYDIAEGEFEGYYSEMRANHPDWTWAGAYRRSYKEKALGMFKRFCSSVSKSNGNYIFDGGTINADERTLAGKKIGIVQTASRMVRRIVTYVEEGASVKKGDWIGMIKFGSQVDMIVPESAKVCVEVGEQVYVQESIIAEL
jgi:hypothetical protein